MRTDHIRDRRKLSRPQVSDEDMRNQCSFWIGRMFLPIEPHQRSTKALLNKVSEATGLGPRRIEKLWRKYVPAPKAKEHETLRSAYALWLERWKAQGFAAHDRNEAEHAEFARDVAGYVSEAWKRARDSRPGDGSLGEAPAATTDGD